MNHPAPASQKVLLVFSQTFVPDPASVGQHMTDVAVEMARRGYRVRVYASARGYENPSVKYPAREMLHGVEVRRLGLASFGKKSILTRVIGTFSFLMQCIFLGLFTPHLGGIFFSTSPPLIGLAACIAKFFRRVPIVYWAMDLNPDQLITMGKIKPTSLAARVLETINRQILKRSDWIFALDVYMAARLNQRGDYAGKMSITPPWPHEDQMEAPPRDTNPFRLAHGMAGKFVIMYSGNHSPANPLATLLAAAVRLKDDPELRFVFVGGGLGKKEVERTIQEHQLTNALSLPYQPLSSLGNSLSAADIHVVSLGDPMVGIIHPCKIYGAMAIGRPILYFGPHPSHVSDILHQHAIGWQVRHGDVEGALRAIDDIRRTPMSTLETMGRRAQEVLSATLSQEILTDRLCTQLEKVMRMKPLAAPSASADAPPTGVAS